MEQLPLLHAELHEQLSKRVFMVYLRMYGARPFPDHITKDDACVLP